MIYLLSHSITNSAQRFPNREAFRFGNESLTYRQMEQRMHQLAGMLHECKVQKGDRVGIYLNRSLETAIAIYGILHAGAVYVPIDPKAPIDRSRFLIEDCDIKILITQPSQKRKMEKIIAVSTSLKTIIGLENTWPVQTISWQKVYDYSDDFKLPFRILEKDLAYIIYTSGSTGQPKGIMHSHYSGLSYARLSAQVYGLTEKDRIGNHAPIHFDISTLGYLTSPFVGACTAIVSDAHVVFPTSLGQLIEKEALTIWYSVPLALIQIIQSGVIADKPMLHLRWVLYGGEPFPPKYLRRLMKAWSKTRISNVYGPAEVNQCTYFHLPAAPDSDESIPIGTVWNNTDYLVMNENDEKVKSGEKGELYIRSATQMLGYWRNQELTERSLYHRNNSSGNQVSFYKTGDLVKEDEKGLLHFLGRKDFQVKIRGYRVELDAVEACLVAHEAVGEAAVFSVRDKEETQHIEAAVILKPDVNITAIILKDFLQKKLPTYAIPEKISIVKEFPRTTSGKIKRSAIADIL